MGDVVKAVDRYRDIPPESRARLKARMDRRDYDDLVVIRRDSITGKSDYRPTIRDMHFGTRAVCRSVTRTSWTASMQERGLVYCDSGNCILVPTVCRNVSRITRAEVSPEHAVGPVIPGAPDDAVPGGPGGTIAGIPDGAISGAPTSKVLSTDDQPTFAAPGEGVPPLGAAGRDDADVASAATPTAGPGTPGLPPGALFVPGLAAAVPVESPGAAPPPAPPAPFATTPVPEPQTWTLMLSGLIALGWLRRRARPGRPHEEGVDNHRWR